MASWTSLSLSNTRIMLIGDSVTDGVGSTDGLGFRDDLYDRLTVLTYPFIFVGSAGESPYRGHFKSGGCINNFYWVPGDTMSYDVAPDMDLWAPQVVMIHLGTNDVHSHDTIGPYTTDGGTTFSSTVSGRLAHLLSYLVRWKTGERGDWLRVIYVSKIIGRVGEETRVAEFNEQVALIVQDSENGNIPLIPPGSLRMVDQYSSFDLNTMMGGDGVHPNDSGYSHVADVYLEALRFLPMYLVRMSGEESRGVAWRLLPQSLIVRVTDDFGNGVSGVDVHYEVTNGDALIVGSQTVQTDSAGFGYASIQLGGLGTAVVTVTSDDLIDPVVTFTVTATEGIRIDGSVTYYFHDLPVPGVGVEWVGSGSVADTTDNEGSYRLEPLPYGGGATIRPYKDHNGSEPISAILSFDAALAARAAIGLTLLSSQERMAADVDGDGRISVNDAAHIARYVVGFDSQENIRVGEWKFVPDSFHYDTLLGDLTGQDFTGILLGDLHGGWHVPASFQKGVNGGMIASSIFTTGLDPFITVPVEVQGMDVLSCDMACEYDTDVLQLYTAEKTVRTEDFQLSFRENERGKVRIGLFGIEPTSGSGAVVNLKFRVLREGAVSPVVFRYVYANDVPLDDVQLTLETGTGSGLSDEIYLMQNFPNPFNEETVIRYRTPERSRVQVRIYNNVGQDVVLLLDEDQAPGSHEILWDGRDGSGRSVTSGLYFYVLTVGEERMVGKMEMLR